MPGMLLVRARAKHHLENVFPDRKNEIFELLTSDYRWRINITKEDYAKVVLDRLMKIDYPNFKDSVEDEELHTMYNSFWWAGLHLQDGYYTKN